MGSTNIEWSDAVWNPTTGCSKVSPGCAHCYAEALSKRYAGASGWPAEFKPWTPANATENVVLHPERLEAPMHWKTPRRVFVNSMSDLFHEQIPDDFIDQVFAVMALTPQHTYQVLTKRPERMWEYMENLLLRDELVGIEAEQISGIDRFDNDIPRWIFPLPNVWLGVSAENQRWADERIPILLDTPAAVRFVSAEPLLGPIDLSKAVARQFGHDGTHSHPGHPDSSPGYLDLHWHDEYGQHGTSSGLGAPVPASAFVGSPWVEHHHHDDRCRFPLDWVIVGGESGPKHRPFDHDWARSIVAQCDAASVACFVKQLGGFRPGTALEDLPEDLRVREYPA